MCGLVKVRPQQLISEGLRPVKASAKANWPRRTSPLEAQVYKNNLREWMCNSSFLCLCPWYLFIFPFLLFAIGRTYRSRTTARTSYSHFHETVFVYQIDRFLFSVSLFDDSLHYMLTANTNLCWQPALKIDATFNLSAVRQFPPANWWENTGAIPKMLRRQNR